jgi:tetratricopeptide (TPR) repeat protein
VGDLDPPVGDLLGLARAAAAQGRYAQALDPVRQILELLDGPRTTEPLGLPLLPYAEACALGGRCLAALGDQAGALEMIQRGARAAETAGHPASRLTVAAAHGRVLVLGSLAREAIAILEPAVATARDKNLGGPLVETLRALGPAYLLAGRAAEAVAAAQEAITRQEATEAAGPGSRRAR